MKKFLYYFIAFGIGLFVGAFIISRSANDKIQKRIKEIQTVVDAKNDSIKTLNKVVLSASDSVSALDSTLVVRNKELATERLKTITPKRVKELEAFILDKGAELYGVGNLNNTDQALIASYGANGLKEVEISRQLIKQQKVIIVNQAGIMELKNEIIVEYAEGLEYVADKCKTGQFKKGLIFGGGGATFLLLLLLL